MARRRPTPVSVDTLESRPVARGKRAKYERTRTAARKVGK